DAAYQQEKSVDVWVLELSSFQLETICDLSANAATCLNISEDHLDRYKDLLDYAYHKDKIFDGAKTQVLNLDDVLCCAMQRTEMNTIYFSLKESSDYWLNRNTKHQALMKGSEYLISMQSLSLQGLHNAGNVLVALALCESIGLDLDKMLAILPNFKGLPHRVEKIGEINSISFIDDSKGTNVGATIAALEGAPTEVVLIAGGLGKGQDFRPLKAVVEDKVQGLFLIGQDAQQIAQVFEHSNIEPVMCDSLEEAVKKAYAVAPANSWILLSPACASMDMFKDYTHRSEVFIKAFEELKNESTK
ncbi:MAG: UDP-N-acetylmuramoyl-L-alanine--D-glutamate ligase, partial [Neisseriaceae bacterium]|nr:UDP-N-acetylmuramoyl-L-alanine--D-glutamate ligase [Neisseriaceae bacterium]